MGRAGSALAFSLMAALGFVAYRAEPALASSVAVSPVNIYLTRDNPSALLTITNQGTESVSFVVSTYAWSQSNRGKMELAPTSDIIFFPTSFTLAPGEGRKIRLGTQLRAGDAEKTYRMLLEELPPPRTVRAVHGMQIHVLSRISLPIFLAPDKPQTQADISEMNARNSVFSFRFDNSGSVHVLPSKVTVMGRDGAGDLIFQAAPPIWYVLAGGSRKFDVALPKRSCAKFRMLTVSVHMDAQLVNKNLETPSGACAS